MTDNKIKVDPNSGAAPQPGGYVGGHGAALGFAGAEAGGVEEEQAPAFYEAPGGTGTPNGGVPVVSEAPVEEEAEEAAPEEEADDSGNSRAPKADAEEAFDPSDHTVEEVQEYLEENPDQEAAVLKAEKAGKARKSLVG